MLTRLCGLAIAGLFIPLLLRASEAPPVRRPIMPVRPVPITRQLLSNSGYIFAGTVLSVERIRSNGILDVPVVQVTFRVTQAIQGVRAGQDLTIREWAGLWASADRYRIGQQVMLFLYRPSRLGLTSPVGGDLGRFHTDAKGRITLTPLQGLSLVPTSGTKAPVRSPLRLTPQELVRMMKSARAE